MITMCSFVKFMRSFVDRKTAGEMISERTRTRMKRAYDLGSAGKGSVQK